MTKLSDYRYAAKGTDLLAKSIKDPCDFSGCVQSIQSSALALFRKKIRTTKSPLVLFAPEGFSNIFASYQSDTRQSDIRKTA